MSKTYYGQPVPKTTGPHPDPTATAHPQGWQHDGQGVPPLTVVRSPACPKTVEEVLANAHNGTWDEQLLAAEVRRLDEMCQTSALAYIALREEKDRLRAANAELVAALELTNKWLDEQCNFAQPDPESGIEPADKFTHEACSVITANQAALAKHRPTTQPGGVPFEP